MITYKYKQPPYKCRMCGKDKSKRAFIEGHYNECRSCVRNLAHFYEMILKSDKKS